MQCILSGFNAFDNQETNPSQQAVELVSDVLPIGHGNNQIEVHKLILPTCCSDSWKALQKAVRKIPADEPFVLVMAGYAHLREQITLERLALNVRDYRIADNRGHQWPEQPIARGGADLLRTGVALGKLKDRLNELALRTEISYHAGTFVCNELYYRALNEWNDDERCRGIIFVHLPSPGTYAHVLTGVHQFASVESMRAALKLQEAAEETTLRQFTLALSETIKFICRSRQRQRKPLRKTRKKKKR